MRKHCYRYQRTLARSARVAGRGFLTGAHVQLRFHPAPPSTGVVFVRSDLRPAVRIPAQVGFVTGTQRRTTLGSGAAQIGLVEHVLAALAGLRIDNCLVELNAPEPPGLDGSAGDFVEVLLDCGLVLQPARRAVWETDRPITVTARGATLTWHPLDTAELKASYYLDYGIRSPIERQLHTQLITPELFAHDLAHCRTFILEEEAGGLRRQGIGLGITASDLLVFGRHGPIDNSLRHANEPARHKILDLVGDLSLFGEDLLGHFVAYRSGHPLNIELVRELARRVAFSCPRQRLAA